MSFPYSVVFVGLLLAYLVYSAWARLDPRFPVAAALVLLAATAVVDALGAVGTANALAGYVFFLLAGGVVLLLVDHVRGRASGDAGAAGSAGPAPPTESADERHLPPKDPLHGP